MNGDDERGLVVAVGRSRCGLLIEVPLPPINLPPLNIVEDRTLEQQRADGDEPVRLEAHRREAETDKLGVPLTLEQMKALHVSRVLAETDWRLSKAARLLAVSVRTVHRMIRDYDLTRPTKEKAPLVQV